MFPGGGVAGVGLIDVGENLGDGGEGFIISDGSVSISGTLTTSGGAATGDIADGGDGGSNIVAGKYGGAYAGVSMDGT